MTGGFSFCDTDIGSLGLYYVPELEDTFVYKPADAESHIETFEGHDGGYFYGSWYSPKEFTLRCYFEDSKIDRGIMAHVYALFKVGRSGKLIFDRRPWCYYDATVTDPVESDFKNYENGLVTIHMKAMYPFARSEIITNTRSEQYHDVLMSNSAVFDKEGMDLQQEFTNLQSDHANPIPIVLCNPGQETAHLGVSIAGDVGEGIVITNATTGQSMRLVAISKAVTTDVGKKVYIDAISGKTILTGGGQTQIKFLYHDYGFLSLASSYPALRDIYINYIGGNTITVLNILNQNVIGKYIFIKDKWMKITSQPDKHTVTVNGTVMSPGSERTMIIPMNEIYITPDSTMDITSLKFLFKPTYA